VTDARQREALARLYRGLEALYQTDTGLDPHALTIPFARSDDDAPREQLLLREDESGSLEVGLMLDEDLLARLADEGPEALLEDARLSDALPVVEGLSHLLYLAEAARRERPVSGLELETQAEVDKLAVCLLHRWPDAPDDAEFDRLVDRLYYRFDLIPDDPDLRVRYDTANRLALGFSRRLRPHVQARRLGGLRADLRQFWHASLAQKRSLAA
jgi:hypothetical protein